jgi:hypothetical protein
VRYDEVASGEIRHAIRFTVPNTRRAYVWPARHFASSLTDPKYPRMGERFRLRANFDATGFPAEIQVILAAMKKYGLILSDNGSAWFITGSPDSRWNNDNLAKLGLVKGSDFEAVDASVFMLNPNSGQARSCDANIDGAVNVVDVQLQVNATLGLITCGFQDLDGNGQCDSIDLQRVVNASLGSSCRVGQ